MRKGWCKSRPRRRGRCGRRRGRRRARPAATADAAQPPATTVSAFQAAPVVRPRPSSLPSLPCSERMWHGQSRQGVRRAQPVSCTLCFPTVDTRLGGTQGACCACLHWHPYSLRDLLCLLATMSKKSLKSPYMCLLLTVDKLHQLDCLIVQRALLCVLLCARSRAWGHAERMLWATHATLMNVLLTATIFSSCPLLVFGDWSLPSPWFTNPNAGARNFTS